LVGGTRKSAVTKHPCTGHCAGHFTGKELRVPVGPIFQIENLRLRKGERLMRRFSSKETQWNNVGSFFRLWRF
jgi:hypothetical protein